jgi:hypothetical protein
MTKRKKLLIKVFITLHFFYFYILAFQWLFYCLLLDVHDECRNDKCFYMILVVTASRENRCEIIAVDGRAKNKDMTQSQLSGTRKNSQNNNEEMVSMMSVDEMPIKPKRLNRNQRKRAGINSSGNILNDTSCYRSHRSCLLVLSS